MSKKTATVLLTDPTFKLVGPYEPPADDYDPGEGEGYDLYAYIGSEKAGEINFNVEEDLLYIRWIEVDESYRRRGIGIFLMHEARKRFHDDIDTNGFADDEAHNWWDNYIENHWDYSS